MSSTLDARSPGPALPSSEDPVVAGLADAVGGPPGRYARLGERRFWTPVRWLVLLTLLTMVLDWLQKAPCRYTPWVEQYQYTRACYTDVYALYFAEQLNVGRTPYLEFPVEYPVVIGGAMQLAASLAGLFAEADRAARFYDITWLLLTACAVVVTVTTARLAGRRRVWDAALVAVAPALIIHGSTNWDLIATALAGLALLAWARRQPVLAGVLLGIATATKLYPVLFLAPLLALAWRARALGSWFRTAVATGVAGLLLVVPVFLMSPYFVGASADPVAPRPLDRVATEGVSALWQRHVDVPDPAGGGGTVEATNAVFRFVELNQTRGADWDSLYFALGKLRVAEPDGPVDSARNAVADLLPDVTAQQPGEPPTTLNTTVAVTFALALAAVLLLALKAPRRPRLAQLLFLTIVAFSLTNKVFSPQFTIWLLPLAVLARPRWRSVMAWQVTEVLVLLSRFYFFIGNDEPGKGIDVSWFISAVLLRDLALLVLAGLVVRDVLRPERDVVRTDPRTGLPTGADDPAGGVLDGAPDRGRAQDQAPRREPVPA